MYPDWCWCSILQFLSQGVLLQIGGGICSQWRRVIASSYLPTRVLPGPDAIRFLQMHWLRLDALCPACSVAPVYRPHTVCMDCGQSNFGDIDTENFSMWQSRELYDEITPLLEARLSRRRGGRYVNLRDMVACIMQFYRCSEARAYVGLYARMTNTLPLTVARYVERDHLTWQRLVGDSWGSSDVAFVVNRINPCNTMSLLCLRYVRLHRDEAMREILLYLAKPYALPFVTSYFTDVEHDCLAAVFARGNAYYGSKYYSHLRSLGIEDKFYPKKRRNVKKQFNLFRDVVTRYLSKKSN